MKKRNLVVRWCATHLSVVFAQEDDPYDYWLCDYSNRTGDMALCVVVLAEVSWPSQ